MRQTTHDVRQAIKQFCHERGCPELLPWTLHPHFAETIDILGTNYVATKVGVSRRTVQRWRAGVHTPRWEHLDLLRQVMRDPERRAGLHAGMATRKRQPST